MTSLTPPARPRPRLGPKPPTRATIRASYRLAPGHSIGVAACAVLASGLGIAQIVAVAALVGAITRRTAGPTSIVGPIVLIGLVSIATTTLRNTSGYSVEVKGRFQLVGVRLDT
ncbi:MAG: hypothetical protein ACYDHH_28925 [Solirubrobacteraceae bacterium]